MKEAEAPLKLKDRIRKLFTNVWTIPNVLTMIRLALVPVFVVLFLNGHKMASLAVFVAASLTDMLDGYLARKLNQITDFGKLFDPLADKLMVLSAMVCQGIAGVFPWSAIIIVACKELLMHWMELSGSRGMARSFVPPVTFPSLQGDVKNTVKGE